MRRSSRFTGMMWIAVFGFSAPAVHASTPWPDPQEPEFFNTPGIMTFAINPPTVTGFSFTGYARDPQPDEIVTIFPISFSPMFEFTSTPGNPASFTITVQNLGWDTTGQYTTRIGAMDNAPQPNFGNILILVNVIPEPATVTLFCTSILVTRRWRF